MPAGSTYSTIATTTLGSAAASYTFSSISGSYTDLILIAYYGSSPAGPLTLQVGNGSVDTGANYSRTALYGTGTTAASFRESNQNYFNTGNAYTTIESSGITNFMNYSNTTTNKTILDRSNSVTGTVSANVYLWRSTSAINTIKVYNSSGNNLITGTTLTLYGIAAA
jgi:hypothetical protein